MKNLNFFVFIHPLVFGFINSIHRNFIEDHHFILIKSLIFLLILIEFFNNVIYQIQQGLLNTIFIKSIQTIIIVLTIFVRLIRLRVEKFDFSIHYYYFSS